MLIELSIQNFRSIKELQTLHFQANARDDHLSDNVVYPTDDSFGVVRSLGIYGANASGKSNVFKAIRTLEYLANDCGNLREGEAISCYEPYLLSEDTRTAPSSIAIEFFHSDGIRYRYSVKFDKARVFEESLDFYPKKQKANIFNRRETDTWETVTFGGLYKGGKRQIDFFPNNTYLAKAFASPSAPQMIRSLAEVFKKFFVLNVDRLHHLRPAIPDDLLPLVAKALSNIDTGISAVEVKLNEEQPTVPDFFPEKLRKIMMERQKYSYMFSHAGDNGLVELFEEDMESEGTQKLFSLLPMLLAGFAIGSVFFIDELERSFHPHIAELIIRLFNDPKVNRRNAQLVFTTHSIPLMSSTRIRRDQVWFTSKTQGHTELYSLSDFDKTKVKSGSPFVHWYDEGRFGATPRANYSEVAALFTEAATIEGEVSIEKRKLGDSLG